MNHTETVKVQISFKLAVRQSVLACSTSGGLWPDLTNEICPLPSLLA
jgi:hypothetical protein